MLIALALSLAASPAALVLYADADVSPEARGAVASQLAQAIGERTGSAPVMATTASPCAPDCAEALRARVGAQVVFVARLFAGVRRDRLEVERLDGEQVAASAVIDLDLAELPWARQIAEGLRPLWVDDPPTPTTAAAPPVLVAEAVPPAERSRVPEIVLGAAASTLAIASGVLWGTAAADLSTLEERLTARDAVGRYNGIELSTATNELDSINTRRNLAVVGFGVAGAAAAVALALLVFGGDE